MSNLLQGKFSPPFGMMKGRMLNFTLVRFILPLFFLGPVAWAAPDCEPSFELAAPPSFSIFDTDLIQSYQNEVKSLKEQSSDKDQISAALQKQNRLALQQFYKKQSSTGTLKLDDAKKILESMFHHAVIGSEAAQKYDPGGQIGFCFGRATFVHLSLLQKQIPPQKIVKIFALGKLFKDGSSWDFHVTTASQDAHGTWWVIDSLFDELLPLEDWMALVGQWDASPRYPMMRFYFTDAAKFQPLPGSYDSELFHSPLYQKYFDDLSSFFSGRQSCLSNSPTAKPFLFTCQNL